jgi:hypothetical protein
MADVKNIVDFEYKVSGAEAASRGQERLTKSSFDLSAELKKLLVQYFSIHAAVSAFRSGVDFVRGSIDMAIEEVEAANKFTVVFGASAASTEAELRALAESTNRAFSDLRTGASGLQDMLVPMGIARDEAGELSVAFVELANDLSSFNNVETAQVLEAMRSALAGQSEPMRRFGVDLRVTAINAELLRMGIEGGTEAATEAQKAQAILNIMYRQSADALGDAERTADSAANQIHGLNADVMEFRQELGEAFIPLIETLIPEIREGFATMGPEVVERIKDMTWAFNEFLEVGRDVADFQSQTSFPVWKEYNDLVGYAWVPTEALLDLWRRWRTDAEEANNALGNLDDTIERHNGLIEALNLKQIEVAVSAYDFALAQLAILSATSGLDLALQGQITRIEQMRASMQAARETAKGDVTIGREGRVIDEVGAVGGGGAAWRKDDRETEWKKALLTEKELLDLNLERLAVQQQMIDMARGAREEQLALEERINEKELAAYQERMAPILSLAQQSADIIGSTMTRNFENIGDQFEAMLKRMAADYLKSVLVKALVGKAGGFFLGKGGIF